MQICLTDLASAPSGRIRFDYTIDLSKEEVAFSFPFQKPVRMVGEVADAAGVITLCAQVQARVFTRCARCDRPVEYDKVTQVEFLLVKELSNGEEELPDEMYLVESDTVELDDILIPELLLDMEMTVLCREDCKGLCPKCGKNLNDGGCGCDRREIDPRLAVLQQLLDKTKAHE